MMDSMTYHEQWTVWKKYATWKTVGSALILATILYVALRTVPPLRG